MGERIAIGRSWSRCVGTRLRLLALLACAFAVFTAAENAAVAAASRGVGYARVEAACPVPRPGEASCFALVRRPAPAADAGKQGVQPFVVGAGAATAGPAGGLTPAELASAYGYNPSAGGTGQTVAIVDAFDDPNIESDLKAFDTEYKLSECTEVNHCFKKVGQTGEPTSLPAADIEGWSVEISLDVEAVHASCNSCKILLVEANSAKFTDLAAAVNEAVALGATEVSNSYGGPEFTSSTLEAAYTHPGVVIAASSGDSGWDSWTYFDHEVVPPVKPNVPSSLPTVVSVGGTSLTLNSEGKRSGETVWNNNGPRDEKGPRGASGGGCSVLFTAEPWQQAATGYGAAGCGSGRLDSDVAAVADPLTGFDIYDTYNCGTSECATIAGKKWVTIGGTSLSAPLISGMYGLAGGSHGVSYPALTLYGHLGGGDLFDITTGGNGYCDSGGLACGVNARVAEEFPELTGVQLDCEGTTACNAATGFDGPTGLGAPKSISLFEPLQPAAVITPPAKLLAKLESVFSSAGSSDPYPGATLSYTWSWGDGSPPAVGATPGHTFAAAGKYTVTLTLTDSYGFKSTPVSTEVTVAERTVKEVEEEAAKKRAEEEAARKRAEEARIATLGPGTIEVATFKAAKPLPKAQLAGTSLQAAANGGVVVKLSCPTGETSCEGTLTLRTVGAVSATARPSILTLASGHFKVAGGKTAAVTLHLSSKAMRLLLRRHSLPVRVQIAAHDPAGATAATTATATLRAPRKHH